MFKKAVFPGKYIQGVGAISELPALVDLFGKQALILASPSVKEKVLPGCGVDLNGRSVTVETFRGECCENELARVSAVVSQKHVDVLAGMGGGKTIDTAKIVADRAGKHHDVPRFDRESLDRHSSPSFFRCIRRQSFSGAAEKQRTRSIHQQNTGINRTAATSQRP